MQFAAHLVQHCTCGEEPSGMSPVQQSHDKRAQRFLEGTLNAMVASKYICNTIS